MGQPAKNTIKPVRDFAVLTSCSAAAIFQFLLKSTSMYTSIDRLVFTFGRMPCVRIARKYDHRWWRASNCSRFGSSEKLLFDGQRMQCQVYCFFQEVEFANNWQVVKVACELRSVLTTLKDAWRNGGHVTAFGLWQKANVCKNLVNWVGLGEVDRSFWPLFDANA